MWVLALLIALYAFLTGLALGWIIRDERAICEAFLVRKACLVCKDHLVRKAHPGDEP